MNRIGLSKTFDPASLLQVISGGNSAFFFIQQWLFVVLFHYNADSLFDLSNLRTTWEKNIENDGLRLQLAFLLSKSASIEDRKEAIIHLQFFIKHSKFLRESLYQLSATHYHLGDYNQARVVCDQIYREEPDNPQVQQYCFYNIAPILITITDNNSKWHCTHITAFFIDNMMSLLYVSISFERFKGFTRQSSTNTQNRCKKLVNFKKISLLGLL